MRIKDVLNHCSGEAGEPVRFAPNESFAEIDVTQNSFEGIDEFTIGCLFKKKSRLFIKIGGSGEGQVLLTLEMVEETAFRNPGGSANILHTRRTISLGAHHIQGRL